jgi:vacuolar-type H+-ATPase subunit E/Vma4
MSDQGHTLEGEILAEARSRAQRALQRAQRDADRIVREAKAAGRVEQERMMENMRHRVEREKKMQAARLQQELQRLRRQAFEDVVEQVRVEAQKELAELAESDEARPMLVRLAVRAIAAMRGDSFSLVLRAQDRERWGPSIAEEVRSAVESELEREVSVQVADEELKASGGLVVKGEGTRELVEQTLEARMGRLWDDIRGQVADMLSHVWDGIHERTE